MKNLKNEEAVSPVIGVILMVVITVIIAAVLAVFAFGVGAPTQSPTASMKITAVNASNDTIWIQHYGGDSIRVKDTAITVETLNADGSILQTMAFDIKPSATGLFEAGHSIQMKTNTGAALWLNSALIDTTTPTSFVNLTLAGVDTVRVTIIDTPSGSVLSKPSAKVT